MELKTVSIIKDSVKRSHFKFINPFNPPEEISNKTIKKFLTTYNLSFDELIFKLNNIDISEVGLCKHCNELPRRVIGNLKKPKLSDTCSGKCGKSYISDTARSNMSKGQVGNKNNKGKRLSPEQRRKISEGRVGVKISMEGRKSLSDSAKRRIDNGTHHVLTRKSKHSYFCDFLNKTIYFNSKTELNFYDKHHSFLNKFYIRERKVSSYSAEGIRNRSYIADYKLKSKKFSSYVPKSFLINGSLPDVIEIKNDNLFFEYSVMKNVREINYNKFKSVLSKQKSILLVNGDNFMKLNNVSELDSLFKQG